MASSSDESSGGVVVLAGLVCGSELLVEACVVTLVVICGPGKQVRVRSPSLISPPDHLH